MFFLPPEMIETKIKEGAYTVICEKHMKVRFQCPRRLLERDTLICAATIEGGFCGAQC